MGGGDSADAMMKKAEKLLRPSMLSMRLKPAWDDAMPLFEKAALQYKVTGSNEKAVEAYEKAAEANLRGGGTSWHAAKHLEAAAKICVEMGKHDRAHQLLIDSSNEYISCGKLSPAAECLGRGARWLEEVKPDSACDLYRQALDMYMKSEMGSMAHDVVQRGAGAMIRKEAFAEAASLLLKWATICYGHENTALMNRAYLGIVVIYLYDGKADEAWASYQDFLGLEDFAVSAEAYAAENLLQAFCSADTAMIQAKVNQGNCWRALDVQVGRLSQQLPSSKCDLAAMSSFLQQQMNEAGAQDLEAEHVSAGDDDDFLT